MKKTFASDDDWLNTSLEEPLNRPSTPESKREESRLVGIYAVVVFSALLLFSGFAIMLSEEAPAWISRQMQKAPFQKLEETVAKAGQNKSIALTSKPYYESDILLTQNNSQAPRPSTKERPMVATPGGITYPQMPKGFQASWTQRTFDSDKISLLMLKSPFTLSQTYKGNGAEYFSYNAYLLRQIGRQFPDAKAQKQLFTLARLSDRMAINLGSASQIEFSGTPDQSLSHLRVREEALNAIKSLNQKPLSIVDLDKSGKRVLNTQKQAQTFQAGKELQAYQQTLWQLLGNPTLSKAYPQTKALLMQQEQLLQQLASHLELRWESVFQCAGSKCHERGNTRVSSMRVYTQQTLTNEQVQKLQS